MSGGASIPSDAGARSEAQALEWQVILWSGEMQEHELQAFQQWLARDPQHTQAWERVQRFGRQLQAAPQDVAARVLQAGLSAQAVRRRRSVLRGLALFACGGLATYGVSRTPPWSAWNADVRTASGERRELSLPDGTQLALNTASAVNVQYSDTQRRIQLLGGEVLVTTAADSHNHHRPFFVQTGQGRVQALGTRFLVRDWPDFSQVSVQVYDGRVELQPRDGGQSLRLEAGQQAFFSRQQVFAPAPADEQAAAWQRGLLVVERWRLADFLREVARYRTGALRCDPAVADLIVSGVYPVKDTDAILQSLARALPVQVRSVTPYWVTVSARP